MSKNRGASQGFWSLVWKQFKKNKISLAATGVLVFFFVVAFFHPFIVGTKPIVCYYKGSYYFPVMGYYSPGWENRIFGISSPNFKSDNFRSEYPDNLLKKDPESWAVWPLFYADPYRKVREREWKTIGKEFERQDEVALLQTEIAGRTSGSLKQRELPAEGEGKAVASAIAAMDDAALQAKLVELEAQKPNWKHFPSTMWKDRPESDNIAPPNRANIFGTDALGRDVFARIVHGTPIALMVGFVSMGIATTLGLIIGSFAGLFGGWVDLVLTRIMDIVLSIPTLIFILAVIAIVPKPTIWHMMAVIGAFGWVGIARLVRGEFLKLRNMEFAVAAKALGASQLRIMFRHLLPNALAPVLVSVSFGIAGAILTESGLSFLGFGVQPPTPSWGAVLKDGFSDINQWWQIVFPGMMIFVAVFTYNLVGEGLQEAMDPRLKR